MKPRLSRISHSTLIWTIVIVLTLIWGSSFIMLKRALEVLTPIQVMAGRMTTSALVLLPFAVRDIFKIPKDKWPALIWFAVLTNILTTLFNAIAQSEMESSFNGMLNTLTPLMTLAVGVLFYHQRIRLWQGIGLLLGLLGSLLLLLVDSSWQVGLINAFAIFTVLATLCTGFTANIIKFQLKGLSIMEISSVAFIIVLPVSLSAAISSDLGPTVMAVEGGWTAFTYVIVLALFANVAGILLFARLVQLSSPVFSSLITYLIPLVAVFWGVMDHEIVMWGEISAMGLILMSVWLVNRYLNTEEE